MSCEKTKIYCSKEFQKKFLNIDFDALLIEQNSRYTNSQEYLTQKKRYNTTTKEHFKKIKELVKEYDLLNNNYSINNTKYVYTYIDTERFKTLNNELKNILNKQERLLYDMYNFINFLLTLKAN
jgi:hypothetical protein